MRKFPHKTPLEILGLLLKELAGEMHKSATLATHDWTEAIYQYCYDNRHSAVLRFVINTPTGRHTPELSHEGGEAMTCIDQIRPKLPDGDWWGILVHLTRDGAVDVKYDYDPDCIERFFEDEDAHQPF